VGGVACGYEVVVIAPEAVGFAPLRWLREIGALSALAGVTVDVIGGQEAGPGAVSAGLRRRVDAVIWSGHGQPNGLLLSDGSVIDGEWIATQVRCGAPRVMVLAACGSALKDEHLESLASEVSRVGVNVVGLPMDSADLGVITFNVEFVRALVAGADCWTAHRVACKRVAGDYPELAAGIFLTPGLTNGYRVIVDRLDRMEGRLDALAALIEEHVGQGSRRRTRGRLNRG